MQARKPDYAKAEREAKALLEQFDVNLPPVDPVRICRELGIDVAFVKFAGEAQRVSGFYDVEENTIFVNKDEFPLRQTFTVAHELAHKILHEEWARSEEYKVLHRDQEADGDPIEKEANAFAAHFLVPRHMLDAYWEDLSAAELSKLFAVSVPVIKNRLAFEYGV